MDSLKVIETLSLLHRDLVRSNMVSGMLQDSVISPIPVKVVTSCPDVRPLNIKRIYVKSGEIVIETEQLTYIQYQD